VTTTTVKVPLPSVPSRPDHLLLYPQPLLLSFRECSVHGTYGTHSFEMGSFSPGIIFSMQVAVRVSTFSFHDLVAFRGRDVTVC
jgi:hypothetical protein